MLGLKELANAQYSQSASGGRCVMKPWVGFRELTKHDITGNGLAAHPTNEARTKGDDDRKARHQLDHEGTAKNHHRITDGQA